MDTIQATKELLLKPKLNADLEDKEKCAVCKFEYNHLIAVTVLTGDGVSETVRQVFYITPSTANLSRVPERDSIETFNRFRGINVIMHFRCEGGHETAQEYGQHKGITYIRKLHLGDYDHVHP